MKVTVWTGTPSAPKMTTFSPPTRGLAHALFEALTETPEPIEVRLFNDCGTLLRHSYPRAGVGQNAPQGDACGCDITRPGDCGNGLTGGQCFSEEIAA